MEGTVTQSEMLAEIADWLTEGATLEEPRIEDGWFTVKMLIEQTGMTEFPARNMIRHRHFGYFRIHKKVYALCQLKVKGFFNKGRRKSQLCCVSRSRQTR